MDANIEASAQGLLDAFPDSHCKKACLKEQLEKYYKKYEHCKMKPKNKGGQEIERDGNTQEETRK